MDSDNKAWSICVVAVALMVIGITKYSTDYYAKQDAHSKAERIATLKAGCIYIDTNYDRKVIICQK